MRQSLLDEMRGDLPEIMTPAEVAAFLRIPLDDLEEVFDELPSFEFAGHVRVRRERLLEWIEQRERRQAGRIAEAEPIAYVPLRLA